MGVSLRIYLPAYHVPSLTRPLLLSPPIPPSLHSNVTETNVTCPPAVSPCVIRQTKSSAFCKQCPTFCSTCIPRTQPASPLSYLARAYRFPTSDVCRSLDPSASFPCNHHWLTACELCKATSHREFMARDCGHCRKSIVAVRVSSKVK